MKLKPSISSIVCWCDGAALAKAVLFAALVFMCGIFVSCGGNSDINNDVIASPEGAWQSPETNELPINLQVGQEVQEIASPAARNDTDDRRPTTDDYSGKVVIKFKGGTDVRLRPEDRDGPFI